MIRSPMASLVVILSSLSVGCMQAYYGQGPFAATDNFNHYEDLGPPVKGSACTWFFAFGERSLVLAYRDAIRKSPGGTTGLARARFTESIPMVAAHLLGVPACVKVVGTPAKAQLPTRSATTEGGALRPSGSVQSEVSGEMEIPDAQEE